MWNFKNDTNKLNYKTEMDNSFIQRGLKVTSASGKDH